MILGQKIIFRTLISIRNHGNTLSLPWLFSDKSVNVKILNSVKIHYQNLN
jgi:hypothetical protein